MSNRFKILFIMLIAGMFIFTNTVFAQVNNNAYKCYTKNKTLLEHITFDELVQLSQQQQPQGELAKKLSSVLNYPIIDNSINCGEKFTLQENEKLGKFVRIASWNIARGVNLEKIKLAFTDSESLMGKIAIKEPLEVQKVKKQIEELKKTDILVLNEVDIGMPRTEYRNVVEELAKTLNYNYAYGVEFLEVDPSHLGLEDYKWSEVSFLFPDKPYVVDKTRYKGLHGSAILSRFPIKNAQIVRLPSSYDWFNGEKKRISELEFLKRHTAEKLFKEEMLREVRHGSRMAVIADIEIPDSKKPLTVVAIHLENRTVPKKRAEQIKVVLQHLQNTRNPIVIAGDFNTTGSDGSPTGVRKEIMSRLKDPNFIARYLVMNALPHAFIINSVSSVTNFARMYTDPTVRSIPIVAVNKEKEVFNAIEDHEFWDNYSFDFRGDKRRSAGKSGFLSNSNERDLKGFVPTFIFERPLGFGKYKLDWIFVKAYAEDSNDNDHPYKMAPHFGMTLYELNYAFEQPLSDHVPITVDLPLVEPKKSMLK